MSPAVRLPLRHRLKKLGIRLICVVVPALYLAYMRLVIVTSRVDRRAALRLIEACAGGEKITLALLHQDIFALPVFFIGSRRLITVASIGDAGDVIAAALERFGFAVVRGGSSTRASRQAPVVAQLIRSANDLADGGGVIVAITPDGSRGPAGAVKAGVSVLAARLGTSVYCIKFHASRALYLKTWDRTMIPLPFSRIRVEISEPLFTAEETRRTSIETTRRRVEDSLHLLHSRAFARHGRRPVPTLRRLEPPH